MNRTINAHPVQCLREVQLGIAYTLATHIDFTSADIVNGMNICQSMDLFLMCLRMAELSQLPLDRVCMKMSELTLQGSTPAIIPVDALLEAFPEAVLDYDIKRALFNGMMGK
jgi:hypothetical protein